MNLISPVGSKTIAFWNGLLDITFVSTLLRLPSRLLRLMALRGNIFHRLMPDFARTA
jgi:hypothetical protein